MLYSCVKNAVVRGGTAMLYAKVRHEQMYDGNIDARFHAFSEPEWIDDPYENQIK